MPEPRIKVLRVILSVMIMEFQNYMGNQFTKTWI